MNIWFISNFVLICIGLKGQFDFQNTNQNLLKMDEINGNLFLSITEDTDGYKKPRTNLLGGVLMKLFTILVLKNCSESKWRTFLKSLDEINV